MGKATGTGRGYAKGRDLRATITRRLQGFYRCPVQVGLLTANDGVITAPVWVPDALGIWKGLNVTAKLNEAGVCEYATLWATVESPVLGLSRGITRLLLSREELRQHLNGPVGELPELPATKARSVLRPAAKARLRTGQPTNHGARHQLASPAGVEPDVNDLQPLRDLETVEREEQAPTPALPPSPEQLCEAIEYWFEAPPILDAALQVDHVSFKDMASMGGRLSRLGACEAGWRADLSELGVRQVSSPDGFVLRFDRLVPGSAKAYGPKGISAILGAVFLDGGYEAVSAVCRRVCGLSPSADAGGARNIADYLGVPLILAADLCRRADLRIPTDSADVQLEVRSEENTMATYAAVINWLEVHNNAQTNPVRWFKVTAAEIFLEQGWHAAVDFVSSVLQPAGTTSSDAPHQQRGYRGL